MTASTERWEEQARYDLSTARAMLDSGRYLYVLFCCQQAIEKALKAVIVNRTGEFPPRLHNLPRLSETAGLSPDSECRGFLGELTAYYIQTRYPEGVEFTDTSDAPEVADETLRRTEEVAEWLFSMIE